MKTAIWVRYTVPSGAAGRQAHCQIRGARGAAPEASGHQREDGGERAAAVLHRRVGGVHGQINMGNSEADYASEIEPGTGPISVEQESATIYKGENLSTLLSYGGRIGVRSAYDSFKFGVSATADHDNSRHEDEYPQHEAGPGGQAGERWQWH